jgi:hypothetical protein
MLKIMRCDCLQASLHVGARRFAEFVVRESIVAPIASCDHLAAKRTVQNPSLVPGSGQFDIVSRHISLDAVSELDCCRFRLDCGMHVAKSL